MSLKEKKRKANGNTVHSPTPTQVDRGRRTGSERRPQSEYHTGHHHMKREERRKSKSLQRLNEAMDLDNLDFKANGTAFFIFSIFRVFFLKKIKTDIFRIINDPEIRQLVHFEIYFLKT